MRKHGPWTIRSSEIVYRDPWIEVVRDEVIRPDGKDGTHSVVHLKPGVSVLAIDTDRTVHLTEEFHYGIGRDSVEAVSGGIEEGEDALTSAQRELQEELGFIAERWTEVGCVDPFTTSVVSPTRLFLAENLTHGEANPEGTELIRCVTMSFDEALEAVMTGEITHAPTCVLILKAARQFGL